MNLLESTHASAITAHDSVARHYCHIYSKFRGKFNRDQFSLEFYNSIKGKESRSRHFIRQMIVTQTLCCDLVSNRIIHELHQEQSAVYNMLSQKFQNVSPGLTWYTAGQYHCMLKLLQIFSSTFPFRKTVSFLFSYVFSYTSEQLIKVTCLLFCTRMWRNRL